MIAKRDCLRLLMDVTEEIERFDSDGQFDGLLFAMRAAIGDEFAKLDESPEAQSTINKRKACCMSKLKVFGTLAVNPDDVLAAGIYTEHTGQPQSTTANLSFVIAKGYVVIRVRDNDAAQFDANPEDVQMLLDHIKQSSK